MSYQYQRLDSDEERLPDGMVRIGYDADEQRYTYRDAEGTLWEGGEGARYGPLHRVGERPSVEGISPEAIAAQNREAWRYMLPFFVLVAAFLLFVIRITRGGGTSDIPQPECSPGLEKYQIVLGDTCWHLAEGWGTQVDDLIRENPGLNCDHLEVGRQICIPHR